MLVGSQMKKMAANPKKTKGTKNIRLRQVQNIVNFKI